jgi:glycosyltransferase involved in cell wall biosynthesis
MNILFFDPYFSGKYGNARYIIDLFSHEELLNSTLYTCSTNEPSYLNDLNNQERFLLLKDEGDSMLNEFGGKISKSNYFGKFNLIKSLVSYSFKFSNLCKKKSIDIVHCNSVRGILTIGLGAKLSGCKTILYVKSNLLSFVYIFPAFLLADKILFQTETNKLKTPKVLLFLFQSKMEILKNAIDIKRINLVLKNERELTDFHLDSTEKNFVYMGSIVYRKGIEFLVEAFNLLKKKYPKINLYLIGDQNADKEYTELLKNKIKDYHLTDDIFFMGHKENPLYYLKEMDFFVLPSLDEGVPKSVIESICMGVPVVATDVGGTKEIVGTKKNGIIVPPKDVESLFVAMEFFMENSEKVKDTAKKLQSDSKKEFSFSRHCEHLGLIYKNLLS